VQSIGSYIFAQDGKNNNNSEHQSYRQREEAEEKDDVGPERSSDNEAREESEHEEKKVDHEDKNEEKKRKSSKDKDKKHRRDKKHKKDKGPKSRKKDKGSKSKKDEENKSKKHTADKNKKNAKEKSLSKKTDNTEDKQQEERSSSKFNSKENAASDQIEGGDSYDDHDFDNDELDYDSQHQQKYQLDLANSEEGENKSDKVSSNDDDNDDDGGQHVDENSEDTSNYNNNNNNNNNNNADYSTLEKNVKRYYNKISRIFHGKVLAKLFMQFNFNNSTTKSGKDSTPRLRQWKSGVRDFARHSGSYSIPGIYFCLFSILITLFSLELKVIFGLLNEWSKHLNQVKPKFEQQVELKQFVVDVLWYELSYRLLSDKHGESLKEAKNRLEKSS
jgi:hypothetical protein